MVLVSVMFSIELKLLNFGANVYSISLLTMVTSNYSLLSNKKKLLQFCFLAPHLCEKYTMCYDNYFIMNDMLVRVSNMDLLSPIEQKRLKMSLQTHSR